MPCLLIQGSSLVDRDGTKRETSLLSGTALSVITTSYNLAQESFMQPAIHADNLPRRLTQFAARQ